MTKSMKASEFKAKCLAVMDEVAATREAVVVTKNGVPIVELVPLQKGPKQNLIGLFKGEMIIKGDIVSPIDVAWDAEK